jgi:ABC-type nitrate/sulfonate/bicarbonate transport system ATPase subunit
VVAQNYPLFDHHTVLGNLELAARKSGKGSVEIAQYVSDFDLTDCLRSFPAQLSGGQRQRTAIIQQVLASSSLILYDEPFSGLDPIAKKKTEELIHRIANLTETSTAVIVTHDVRSALAVSDHLWLLGRDRAADGSIIPGAYIKESINLIDRNLAWHAEIREMPEFAEAVVEIERKFQTL